MINGKKVVALIPARGGSKGIKNKNIIPLNGRPLIDYTIREAQESCYIDEVIVTTDSEKIAEISRQSGAFVPFLRPPELATDQAKTIDTVLHAIKWLKENNRAYDILVLLQPTQPLRESSDIDSALEVFEDSFELPLASVCEVDDNPILIRTIDENGKLRNMLNKNSTVRRQDMSIFYKINGAIYINLFEEINDKTSFNDNVVPFVMCKEKSVDIDDINDLEFAKIIMTRR